MSDINALAEKLATLASREPVDTSGARILIEDGSPDPIAALLQEVDNTVLERSLVFTCGDAAFTVIAAGRRLRGIISASAQGESSIIGQVLSREEPEGVQDALAVLQANTSGAETLTVRSRPPEPFGKGGERGISAKGLAELWSVGLDTTPQPPVEQFLSVNAPALKSVLHVRSGEIVSTSGDFKALQKIWTTQSEAFREAHRKTTRGEEGAQLVCLEDAFEDGGSAAMLIYEDEIALVAYEADGYAKMQSSWQRIFA